MAEAERVKPRPLYEAEAIEHALEQRWSEAVATNRALLDRYGPDEDAYNRLGKALLEQGKLKEALKSYQQSLDLNPLNLIAQKNTKKIGAMIEAPNRITGSGGSVAVDLFTEEPGKSSLTVLTPPSGGVVVTVVPGDAVDLEVDGTSLHARTARGVALGDLDTKLTRRLMPLLQTGNRYAAAVARVQDDRIELMIREIHQAPENSRKSSFPIARGVKKDDFRSYTRDSLLNARGVDDDPFDLSGDGENLPGAQDEPVDDLAGMHDADDGDAIAAAEDDEEDADVDVDVRPEDEY